MTETTPNLPEEDQDSGPATTPEDIENAQERDRAEGDPDAAEDGSE